MKEKFKYYTWNFLKIVIFLGFLVLVYATSVFIYKNVSDVFAKNILEYCKVLVWPIVVLVIAFTFKRNIAGLIERVEEWEIPGFGKGRAHTTPSQPEATTETDITVQGEDFKALITTKESEIQSLQDGKQQLVDKLTRAEIELDFERVYNFIFANQIDLLSQMNSLGGEIAFEYVAEHFNKVQQTFVGLKDWNVVKYLEFLINNQLLEYKTPSGSNFVSVVITSKGKAFVAYIVARNYRKYGL